MKTTVTSRDPRSAWAALLSPHRLGAGAEASEPARSPYQRDWDRILYSTHFRRLAGKTQVFPLPLDDHVHSRLTHSLEVAAVGRSLGILAGHSIRALLPDGMDPRDVGDCVAAACLAHDIGNPPFGHAGEEAFREFFGRLQDPGPAGQAPSGSGWFAALGVGERSDLVALEGNAIALRLATRQGPLTPRGLDLTCATLGALVKYPCGSVDALGKRSPHKSRTKHGIDASEFEMYAEVADVLGLLKRSDANRAWFRHPLAFLTEAADDIAYQIIDLEDGLRLGHVSQGDFLELLGPLCRDHSRCPPLERQKDRDARLELAGLLRSTAIDTLAREAAAVFAREHEAILAGEFDHALVSRISDTSRAHLERIQRVNQTACYSAREVLKLELAGSVAIQAVLGALTEAAVNHDALRSRHLRKLLPAVFAVEEPYPRTLRIVDFVAGMTDHYVVRLYRELSGIRLPGGRD